ncbi:MAG TPA: protein-disulfide reductase DsbD domain-containing protein [Rhizobiaceae bacterium]
MKLLLGIPATILALATSGSACASSSDWFEVEGARMRLVTSGRPDAQGRLEGILDIELKPGWKTYWRDPGDAGVPPTVDVSANHHIAGVALAFPAPQRHDEGDFKWAGYDYPLGLPVTFSLKDPAGPATIDADVFIGVCETICVPVQAKLALDTASDPDNPDDAAAVSAAFAAIPPAATREFGVTLAKQAGDAHVVLEAAFPGDPETAELFIAGEDGYVFSTPVREERDGKTFFSVEMTRPDEAPKGAGLHYTLVTDKGAVNGVLPYF